MGAIGRYGGLENQCPHNNNAQVRIDFYVSECSYIILRDAQRYYVNYLSLHYGLFVAQRFLLDGINRRNILEPHTEALLLIDCEERHGLIPFRSRMITAGWGSLNFHHGDWVKDGRHHVTRSF